MCSVICTAKDPVARKMRLRLRRQQSNQAAAGDSGEQAKQATVLKVSGITKLYSSKCHPREDDVAFPQCIVFNEIFCTQVVM